MKQLRIALITQAPFPKGNVTTIRYTSYLKEFVKKGIYSLVLIYCPTRMAANNKLSNGVYEGIEYQYSTRITWSSYNVFSKIYYLIIGLINSIKYIRLNRINTLILNGDNIIPVVVFYYLIAKIYKLGYICERDEKPSIKIRNSKILLCIYKFKYSLFDGIIVMTKELDEFYSTCCSKQSSTFILPMTIDPNRYSKILEKSYIYNKYGLKKDYIAVVFGIHNRDGILESLKSYIEYKKTFNGKYDLVLVGPFNMMSEFIQMKTLIEINSLSDSIHICGKVDIDVVPSILIYASCLLTTPNYYISGGFPTKIGEYMLSGVPIVASETGELNKYINRSEIHFSTPGNIHMFAERLHYVELNKDECLIMAQNAKKKVEKVFFASNYSMDMLIYIKQINENITNKFYCK